MLRSVVPPYRNALTVSGLPVDAADELGPYISLPSASGPQHARWGNLPECDIALESFSVAVLYKHAVLGVSGLLWGKKERQESVTAPGWVFGYDAGRPVFDIADGTFQSRARSEGLDEDLDDGLWHVYVGTWDSPNQILTLYVDGQIGDVDTPATMGSLTDTVEVFTGSGQAAGSAIIGGVGSLWLWKNRILSQYDVGLLYADPFGMVRQGISRSFASSTAAPSTVFIPVARRY